jgi:flavin-dependent dehydrogenase
VTDRSDNRVVIAGSGVAGAVAACDLRGRDFDVWILELPRLRPARGVEAIPAVTIAALRELGLEACLARAGATASHGFDNAWRAPPRVLDGLWAYFERDAFARALRDEAIARGAHVVAVDRIPPLTRCSITGGYRWQLAGLPTTARTAIDATGRAAVWSRPLARQAPSVAALFRGPGSPCPRRGRITRTADGWAYALFHPDATTVGIVSPAARPGHPRTISDDVAHQLALPSPAEFRPERRCAAHAQWAATPATLTADHARFAIGDAALAYAPLAGQGLRFAIASAAAAAACTDTCRTARRLSPGHLAVAAHHDEPFAASPRRRHLAELDAAALYYEEFATGARRRHLAHLAHLDALDAPDPVPAPALATNVPLQFAAEIAATGVRRGPRIVPEAGLRLADGELIRWLGPFDLLALRALARAPSPAHQLHATLCAQGLDPAHADAVLRWCVARGVLTPVPAPPAPR